MWLVSQIVLWQTWTGNMSYRSLEVLRVSHIDMHWERRFLCKYNNNLEKRNKSKSLQTTTWKWNSCDAYATKKRREMNGYTKTNLIDAVEVAFPPVVPIQHFESKYWCNCNPHHNRYLGHKLLDFSVNCIIHHSLFITHHFSKLKNISFLLFWRLNQSWLLAQEPARYSLQLWNGWLHSLLMFSSGTHPCAF